MELCSDGEMGEMLRSHYPRLAGKQCFRNVCSAVFFIPFSTGSGCFSLPFFLAVNRGREFKMHRCLHIACGFGWR